MTGWFFFGVTDECFDVGLLGRDVDARPNWQFVMIGSVAKISPESLDKPLNPWS